MINSITCLSNGSGTGSCISCGEIRWLGSLPSSTMHWCSILFSTINSKCNFCSSSNFWMRSPGETLLGSRVNSAWFAGSHGVLFAADSAGAGTLVILLLLACLASMDSLHGLELGTGFGSSLSAWHLPWYQGCLLISVMLYRFSALAMSMWPMMSRNCPSKWFGTEYCPLRTFSRTRGIAWSSNGSRPAYNPYNSTPRDQISLFEPSYFMPSITSGAA
mmetsp:Transcript_84459/g.140824  ORF Transcript_84459/g.140824 Transcript_84459/m.140824 type:complete len:218 (-) Transcript_84459:592-1245(-)